MLKPLQKSDVKKLRFHMMKLSKPTKSALTQICTQILEVVDSKPLKRWYCWLAMVLSRRKILVTEIGRIERLELHEVFYMFEARDGCGGTYLVLLDGVGEDFFSRWPGEDERREIESAAKLCLISKTQTSIQIVCKSLSKGGRLWEAMDDKVMELGSNVNI